MQYAEREWFENAERRAAPKDEKERAGLRGRVLEDRLATKVGLLLDEGLDAKAVASMAGQWNAGLAAWREYPVECERVEAAAGKLERHAARPRKAKVAFKLMNPSPEEQARLYEFARCEGRPHR